MRAELMTGEIVELKKDCLCLDSIHAGPHWLHSDAVWHALNHKIFEQMQAETDATEKALLHYAWCDKEIQRLQEKAYYFRLYGIKRLIR